MAMNDTQLLRALLTAMKAVERQDENALSMLDQVEAYVRGYTE